jgi:hypothetical protein
MPVVRLLVATAFIEALTGILLVATPEVVARWLLGENLVGAGLAVARLLAAALLSLALMAWRSRHISGRTPALAAMLSYNVMVAALLAYLGFQGQLTGVLLWPAVAIHAVVGLSLTCGWLFTMSNGQTPN